MTAIVAKLSSFQRPAWLRLPLVIGCLVLAFWFIVAFTIDLWSPYTPLDMVGRRLQPPSAQHWLGTDALGRDVLSRTLYGAQQSIPTALTVVLIAVAIGSLLGGIAGFWGGAVGAVIMRLVDITLSFPAILLAMAVAAGLGPGLRNATIAMVLVWWPVFARLMRAQVLEVKQRDHVEAAIASGVPPWRVFFTHVLSLCWTPILVHATMDLGQVVLLAASLSFIGLGATPPTPEWGAMIAEGAAQFYQWWIAFGPGMAILTLVLGFNFVGDGLRDALDRRGR
ncbi:ABC transporter permease [Rhodoligotrophos defluvii]|uniref:ABC transporter permease n=1 Tax=Rhodoligotrophos defluvii TaxID=2561934 RepID=UPI0010C9BFDB|nr:ABC transporter permease [Rhodoligotrophos defluvii]